MTESKSNGNTTEPGVVNPKNIQHDEKKLKNENSFGKISEEKIIKEEKEHKVHTKDRDRKEKDKDKDKNKDKDKEKDKEKDREKKKKRNKDSKKKKKKSKDRSRSRSAKRRSKKSRSRSKSEERSRKRKRSESNRKRKKSISLSISKSPSRKKSKSKSISKRNRKFRFDSPPKDKNNFNPIVLENPILTAALTQQPQPLVQQLPIIQVAPPPPIQQTSPPPMGFAQPPQTSTQSPAELLQKIQMLNTLQNIQASKSDRKLYIGNLPPNLTPQTLCDVLNSALQKMGVNTNPGNSIVSAWISNDGHYAFVEFRTPEEANNGFTLNNVALFGQHLKVGRPRTYAATQALSQGSIMIPGLNSVLPGLNPLNPLGNPLPGGVLPNSMFGGSSNATIKVQPPTRVLILKNMIQVHELEIDEEYSEILEDVKEECAKYGEVLTIKIPRPKSGENVDGLGKIFVEFANVEQSKEARKNLAGRTFSSNTVECSYHDEKMYFENNLAEI